MAEEERIGTLEQRCMNELWNIIDEPAAPPEPERLDDSWLDALSLETMKRAATLLERLPQEFEKVIDRVIGLNIQRLAH
jgi:hypothetical protein